MRFTAITRAAVAALAFTAAGCASSAALQPEAAPDVPLAVIDAHLHTNFDDRFDPDSKVMDSRDGLAEEMRQNHVVGAVSMDHQDDAWADLGDLHIVHCVGLEAVVDESKLEADLASGRYRCIKIYLGYVHQYAYDPAYEAAYRLAEKFGVPVVFHTGDTDSAKAKLKYADPLTIDEVAVDHPSVTFVLAHAGNPWIQSAAEVAYKNPNVVIDGSAFLIGDLASVPTAIVDTQLVAPVRWIFDYVADPAKLMFGTDWPLVRIEPYLRAFAEAIPREHWQAVFHDNAARVYGFR
ncbi:MAG TPA: amidohydrolase family protein [Thermoanaerobaculales bacterium]|mgnify:FL=1|nr:amidohydrolase family protein [Thermoanaerobaculales bacterium]HPA79701.1 amidohydrolase family protein [Thermoanaerobaculales bacterium]HQL31029.1 amidohydrolase family protein [Thermoanaerobaculales bacterium]HQN95471.1 amidohydrolase family protein [Thermoanaerobaculales bacterium]HQP42200.1 amidohydrolase family protein [Thermoanaerobaculales bacterium]